MNEHLKNIVKKLLLDAQDDYVGLWQIVARLSNISAPPSGDYLRQSTLLIVAQLLDHGVVAGQLIAGGGFEQWMAQDSISVLKRIEREWKELGGKPEIGDICWFNLVK